MIPPSLGGPGGWRENTPRCQSHTPEVEGYRGNFGRLEITEPPRSLCGSQDGEHVWEGGTKEKAKMAKVIVEI